MRAGLLEQHHVLLVSGTHQHRYCWRVLVDQGDHPQSRDRVVKTHHHRRRTVQARRHQVGELKRIAHFDLVTIQNRGFNHLWVHIQRDVRDILLRQQLAQIAPGVAKATDQHMLVNGNGMAGDGGDLQRLAQPIVWRKTKHQTIGVLNQKRRSQHRQHHGRQHWVGPARVNQALRQPEGEQHKTKLARLRQINTCACGHTVAGPACVSQYRNQNSFDQHGNNSQHQHPRPLLLQHMPVELHAKCDEEQAQEHIMERPNVFFHTVLVIGFCNQHARHERAHRHGQTGMLGEPSQAQRDEQNIQHEQFFAVAPVNDTQPHPHDLLSAPQQQPHQHRRFEQRL